MGRIYSRIYSRLFTQYIPNVTGDGNSGAGGSGSGSGMPLNIASGGVSVGVTAVGSGANYRVVLASGSASAGAGAAPYVPPGLRSQIYGGLSPLSALQGISLSNSLYLVAELTTQDFVTGAIVPSVGLNDIEFWISAHDAGPPISSALRIAANEVQPGFYNAEMSRDVIASLAGRLKSISYIVTGFNGVPIGSKRVKVTAVPIS